MTTVAAEDLARRFLAAYEAKDLDVIAGLLAEDVLLRDWNLEVQGKAAFLAETQRNFEAADTIAIDIDHVHATEHSAAVEVVITVDSRIRLLVVDVFEFDDVGFITAVRSYKGREL